MTTVLFIEASVILQPHVEMRNMIDLNRCIRVSVLLTLILIVTSHALFSVNLALVNVISEVDQGIHVALSVDGINSTVMERLMQTEIFNSSTIPGLIVENYKGRGYTNVLFYGEDLEVNPAGKSIEVSFYLVGADVVNFEPDRNASSLVYTVRTEWRRVNLKIRDRNGSEILTLNLAKYFGRFIEEWNQTEYMDPEGHVHKLFVYEYHGSPSSLENYAVFRIILPRDATDVKVIGDIITFRIPLPVEDAFLSSPFIILIAVVFINLFALVRRWEMKEGIKKRGAE